MKRILTAIVCIALLCAALPLCASADGAGWYVVDSQSPMGYCYLYSAASSMDDVSRNLGRYDNGEYVYVIDYYGGNGYCYVSTQDGKTGYIGAKALRRYYGEVREDNVSGWYVVDSQSPKGYCYLYSAASSMNDVSRNLGRYDNGEYVYVIDYYGGNGYCYVSTQDGKTGYIGAKALKRYYGDVWEDTSPGWFLIASRDPQGYCYLYSEPSSMDGVGYNKGRHNNGEQVYVLSYYGGNGYCFVRTEDGETGYIGAKALMRVSDIQADPTAGWYMVASSQRSYCYLYSKASSSSSDSRNLGRYDNGEWVYVVDFEGENGYSYVFTQDGKTGFMATSALMKY